MNSTLSTRPSRHVARASTTPPGASSRTTVSGSAIATMPVSSRTVVVQIVFEPDMAGYSVGSMMMKPASQSGRVEGTTRFAWQATLPRGSRSSSFRSASPSRSSVCICSNTVAPAGGKHAADDDVPDLAAGVAADDGDHPPRAHDATLVVEQLEQLRDRVPVARGRDDAEPLVVEELRERRALDAVRIPRVELAPVDHELRGAISAASSSRATFAGSCFERKLTR